VKATLQPAAELREARDPAAVRGEFVAVVQTIAARQALRASGSRAGCSNSPSRSAMGAALEQHDVVSLNGEHTREQTILRSRCRRLLRAHGTGDGGWGLGIGAEIHRLDARHPLRATALTTGQSLDIPEIRGHHSRFDPRHAPSADSNCAA